MSTRPALLCCALCVLCGWTMLGLPESLATENAHEFPRDVQRIFKKHCIKCHGVAKREGNLQLHTPLRLWTGGDSGKSVVANSADQSLMWQRISKDEMPPDAPLSQAEKDLVQQWIDSGAKGLPKSDSEAAESSRDEHWAFTKLAESQPPAVQNADLCTTSLDLFLESELERVGLSLGPTADREQLVRRLTFTLTGLPPGLEMLDQFLGDDRPDAYERLIESILASPQFGVRWGGHWLDAAGYADSNGYFNADSDRPLAFRYRDYVVRAFNCDKPFDRFVQEQIAGDELSNFQPEEHKATATAEMIDQLVATHFLRNGQDGTGESDGNADEVRIDRYTALESSQQIIASSLLGLTIQCAKCHDHKFEPITQRDFYSFQAVLYPAFNPDHWVKPNDRVIQATESAEYQTWHSQLSTAQARLSQLQSDFKQWLLASRRPEQVLFEDRFEQASEIAKKWTSTIPGDDVAAGQSPVTLLEQIGTSESDVRPAALIRGGQLQIIEGGVAGDKWLSTQQVFDWTPESEGQWIQVTFDLMANKVTDADTPAERIAFGIALHDFDHNSSTKGGNILIDGNPSGGAVVDGDYPGSSARRLGAIGATGYIPGRSFGIRLTRLKNSKIRLEQLVDFVPDGKSLELNAADLPRGSFGFEYCCNRSFIVDNVVIELAPIDQAASRGAQDQPGSESTGSESTGSGHRDSLKQWQLDLEAARKQVDRLKQDEPGRIAWVTDSTEQPPDVFMLARGNYSQPADKVEPEPLTALQDEDNRLSVVRPASVASSGRRLAWSTWLTRPNSRPSHLMARVQVNRLWQHYFGTGLVSTSENLGMSGADPSNRRLLDWLASELIRHQWNFKPLHRLILTSMAFRQSSAARADGLRVDPQNQLIWRYPMRRLDAEAIRDAQLAMSGELETSIGGPYVPTKRTGTAEVIVAEGDPGAARRSIYLQHRRSQGLSLLGVFDAPSIVVNCARRPVTTMPLQSLALMNSEFCVNRGKRLAERCRREISGDLAAQVGMAIRLTTGRCSCSAETWDALEFIEQQRRLYEQEADAELRALADFCQMLLASNLFLYLE